VLCTQVTGCGVDLPAGLPGCAVPTLDRFEGGLASGGISCAESIVIRVPDFGPVEVVRLDDHQSAQACRRALSGEVTSRMRRVDPTDARNLP
jgi:hypothetical protein